MARTIYLDHAAATPADPRVVQAMLPYFTDDFYNPSATYAAGRAARVVLEKARAQVAHWLGAKSSEIIFTAGGTESNNLAIHGVMRQYPDSNLVTVATEHDSVLVPARRYDCRIAAVQPDGRIDLADLRGKIDEQTVLVSVSYANNEIGTVQPLREVGRLLEEIRQQRQTDKNPRPLYLHSDACQAGNYLDLHVARLGVDLLTLDGSKIYGPKQSGCLFVKAGTKLQSLIDGGHQERGLRGGTENVPGSVGFATALDITQADRHDETDRLAKLRDDFMKQLETDIPDVVINGSRKYRLPNNIHVTIPGQDNERLLMQLDEAGIQAGAGSACNASDEEPSHVLRALGLSETEARSSLRFSLGRQTTPDDMRDVATTLQELVAQNSQR
jgi:cysteine desulfurase